MSTTFSRKPDQCLTHTSSGLFRSDETATSGPQARLVQHSCAEPSCEPPAGWYYTSNDLNAAGPGLCTDQHVLEHLARRQRSDRTFGITAGALLIAAAPAIMAILGFTHPDQFPQPYYFTAAAAVAALIREIRKPLRVRLTTR